MDRLAAGDDPEALHDARVAVRRLRTWLRAFRDHSRDTVKKRQLRALGDWMDRTNAGRDAEVHLMLARRLLRFAPPRSRAAMTGFLGMLQQQVVDARPTGDGNLSAPWRTLRLQLRKALAKYRREVRLDGDVPPTAFGAAHGAAIRRAADEMAECAAEAGAAGGDAAPLHALRIAAKRARYVIEPLRNELKSARSAILSLTELQDVLGETHDRQLMIARSLHVDARALGWLATRLQADVTKRTDDLRTTWLARRMPRLLAALRRIASAREQAGRSGVEIERKYLLNGVPDEVAGRVVHQIRQGWLPGKILRERLRAVRAGDGPERFFRTVKGGVGLSRIELEEEADAALFRRLWPLTRGRRVVKDRIPIPAGDFVWEIDVFRDRALVLAEVELPSPEVEPAVPPWLAGHVVRDVTGDPRYANSNLAR